MPLLKYTAQVTEPGGLQFLLTLHRNVVLLHTNVSDKLLCPLTNEELPAPLI